MPHATMPSPGFQALILCGPGASLNTFTSNPKDFPKALVPIANRPMVWYPLEWCYRMGITNIQLITPPESLGAIEAALSQNPHLTSLPAPKPDILAPDGLIQTTGTAEIFRFPEVQASITGDFIVLPCDLVCEQDGSALVEAWMVQEAGLGGSSRERSEKRPGPFGVGAERIGRRGGLSVWYPTKGEGSVKGEETDFIATTTLPRPAVPPPLDSVTRDISNLVYALPKDTLNDIAEEAKYFPIRHSLIKRHGSVKMRSTYRDAHAYLFPSWVADFIAKNERFDSISEDVVGWWAKSGWQRGLGEKVGLRDVLQRSGSSNGDEMLEFGTLLDDEVDITELISTWTPIQTGDIELKNEPKLASRVRGQKDSDEGGVESSEQPLIIPPILAYVQPSEPTMPLIRRVDTAQLLLNVSLRLAKLPSAEEVGKDAASPFAHPLKIAHLDAVPKRCRVESENSLLAENVTVEEKCNIKESVIGANCKIGSGVRLMRCLLMDGVEVGENCQLSGCILGRRCRIEGGAVKGDLKTVLKECEVQEGQFIEWGTEAKDEKFMRFDGLSDDEEFVAGEEGDMIAEPEPDEDMVAA